MTRPRLSCRVSIGGALAGVVLIMATGCTTINSTEEPVTMAPLDEAALVRLKQTTAEVAKAAFGQLSSGGANVQSAVGSWDTCADDDPSFGQFNVTGVVTIPTGEPVPQLDPLVSALESDGWTAKRQTAPKGNALADLRKSEALLQLTADGSADLQVELIGPCIQSDLIGTDGYRFSVDHTPIDVR
ncbi:MAG: hypothetical protein ABWZ02_03920 [Nakamurella sp.]